MLHIISLKGIDKVVKLCVDNLKVGDRGVDTLNLLVDRGKGCSFEFFKTIVEFIEAVVDARVVVAARRHYHSQNKRGENR